MTRVQERAELQQLNDRFAAYVQRMRLLAEKDNRMDSTAIINSTKALENELHNLKNMYEQELERFRNELENCNHERVTHQVQLTKQMQYSSDLQDRLNVETDKTSRLQDELNILLQRIGNLEDEIRDAQTAAGRPHADVEQLERKIDNLTRECETWKHRYEHEEVARQEADEKIQQMMQKADFSARVNAEQMAELQSRLDTSAATIISLEARIRDLSKTDMTVADLLKQVRATAAAELMKYQMESEEQYNRNLSVLKAQLDNDAKMVERLETERTHLQGSTGELQARIRSLEGQVGILEHQKQTLEDIITVERKRGADNIQKLEHKLHEVQELLVAKMREVTTVRENNIPLRTEIEALKTLLAEEERRMQIPLAARNNIVASSSSDTKFMASKNPPVTAVPSSASTTAITTVYPAPATSENIATFTEISQPYVPSLPLSTTYIPEALLPGEEDYDTFDMPAYSDEVYPEMRDFNKSPFLSKYMYDSTPALNKLSVEPSPPAASGPVRAKSAPAERQCNLNLIPTSLGQGHDYFERMFHDLQRDTLYGRVQTKSSPAENGRIYDYVVSSSSSTGNLKICEVHPAGKYVRLQNDGVQEVGISGYMIQQNMGGHPVAVYRFPPHTKFPPNGIITVYANCSDHNLHNPPKEFIWKEQQKWGTGPECTTILCRPNGQAVAWTTATHRIMRDAYHEEQSKAFVDVNRNGEEKELDQITDDESITGISVNNSGLKPNPLFLKREKQQPPSLRAKRHPHSHPSSAAIHPHTTQPRPYRYGNDNSSNNRQSRSQSTRPDPVHGQPYAGTAAQRMRSAPLRKYISGISSQQPSAGSRTNENNLAGACEGPSSFMKPHARFQSGLDQVQSQHNAEFLPPMPRPFPLGQW